MKEIDGVALYHYKLKLAHEDRLRKRFGRTQKQSEADAEDEATAALVQGVVNDISFGDLVDGEAEDLAAEASASDDSSDSSSSDEYESDDGSDDDDDDDDSGGESGEGVKPPPPPPKSPRPERLGGTPSIGHKQNNVSPTPVSRAATMKASRSEMTASSVSLDLEAKDHLTAAQRLRNSKSMEMLRRGKSMSVDLPPPPPIPQQQQQQPYQVYRPKRTATVNSTHPPQLTPHSSSGSLRRPPPTRKPPSPPKETALPDAVSSRSISNSTITPGSRSSTTTIESEGSTWSSRTSSESDKNKPLPDPKTRVGLDPDRTPRMPQADPDATPKIGQKKPKLKRVDSQIKPPELTHTPKLLPVFVELVCWDISSGLERLLILFGGDYSSWVTSPRSSNEVVDWH